MSGQDEIVEFFYPEAGISGYTSVDGTIEFYGRVNSILDSSMRVLDFGAGRAAWFEDDPCQHRRKLRNIRGKVEKLIGCDMDTAIEQNKSVDERIQIEVGELLPFEDESIDLIVSDYTFEHIANPAVVAEEFRRILKPGGWICARTPNKYAYTSILTRLVPNRSHRKVLNAAQPERKDVDIFPTTFLLNSIKDIEKYFGRDEFENYTYRFEPEPAYHFNSKLVFSAMLLLNRLLPEALKTNLFVFLRKTER